MSLIKCLRSASAGLFMVLLLVGSALTKAAPPVVINYLIVDGQTAPFQILEDGKSAGGIVTDIIDEIFRDSDYHVRYRVLPVNRLRHEVIKERIPAWITFEAPLWDSLQGRGEFTETPLFDTRHVLLTCNDDIISPIDSINDLVGLSLASLKHFNYLVITDAQRKNLIKSVTVDSYKTGFSLLRYHRVDGFVEMDSRIRYHLKKNKQEDDCLREVDVSAVIPAYPIYLKMDAQLQATTKQFINHRLKNLAESGVLARIWASYVSD